MKEGKVVVAPSVATAGGERIFEAIQAALKGAPRCSVALAGGSTPRGAYEQLVRLNARTSRRPLESADFYFGDERCVPPEDKESNYAMARAALGGSVKLHRMEAERGEPAAKDYERLLPQTLDVLILGIGEDGHTCSLFPGAPTLSERTRRVLLVKDAPKPPPERLTITPPVIAAARSIVVLASGAAKAAAVARALEGAWNPHETPAQLAREGTWVLDADAASQLRRKPT